MNRYLEEKNLEKRVDHRSYERQGRDEIPTIHMGASASALERKGIRTEKGDINRDIRKLYSPLSEFEKQQEKDDQYRQRAKEKYQREGER